MKQFFHRGGDPSIWAHRDVRLLIPARTLAAAGQALALLTLLLRVHDGGHGPAAVAGLLACFAGPTIVTMGIAGSLADRRDSRSLLVTGSAMQLIAALGLAADPRLSATYVFVVVFALGQSLVAPVWAGLLPRVVGEERLGSAIAWQQGLGAVAGPAGAAVGGVVYQTLGPRAGFLGTAATAVVLMTTSLALRTRRHLALEAPGLTGRRTRTLDGLARLRRDDLLWTLFVALLALVVVVEGVNTVEVFLARDELSATPAQYGLSEIASAIGGVVGAGLVGRLRDDGRRVRACLVGFGGAAAAIAAAGLAPDFWVYLALVVGLSAGAGAGNAAAGALLIGRTPDADRGKVQAGLGGAASTARLLALAGAGLAAGVAGPRTIFVAAGVGGAAVMATAALVVARRPTGPPTTAIGARLADHAEL